MSRRTISKDGHLRRAEPLKPTQELRVPCSSGRRHRQARRENDLDLNEKLAQVDKYAKNALDALKDAQNRIPR